MQRYINTKRKVDADGKRVYGTTYYPEIPIGNSDTFIQAADRTRLDSLAFTHYGDVSLWWIIAKANGIKGINVLKTGQLIRIPGNVNRIVGKFLELNGG
tara:strand:- start:1587 stop:1883 length:297 start_codon:yes stop_codon:yes gene_type:complete